MRPRISIRGHVRLLVGKSISQAVDKQMYRLQNPIKKAAPIYLNYLSNSFIYSFNNSFIHSRNHAIIH